MNEDKDIKVFTGKDENEARQKANEYARQNQRILERVESVLNESTSGASVRATMRRQMLFG